MNRLHSDVKNDIVLWCIDDIILWCINDIILWCIDDITPLQSYSMMCQLVSPVLLSGFSLLIKLVRWCDVSSQFTVKQSDVLLWYMWCQQFTFLQILCVQKCTWWWSNSWASQRPLFKTVSTEPGTRYRTRCQVQNQVLGTEPGTRYRTRYQVQNQVQNQVPGTELGTRYRTRYRTRYQVQNQVPGTEPGTEPGARYRTRY